MAARRDTPINRTQQPSCLHPSYPTRRLHCPCCHRGFDVAKRAMSVCCPSCGRQIQLQDAVLAGLMAGNVSTLGRVVITRKGAVRGRVECGSLHVEGAVSGTIQVRGPVRIDARAALYGKLSAESLVVAPGARLEVELHIGKRGRGAEVEADRATAQPHALRRA
jgi:cytoskeletal protein CcmA (bactofilin family)